jgi:hypothetical protein
MTAPASNLTGYDTMGTKHQRFTIDRAFMQALKPTGAYQEYADTELRGFRVKVTPAGLRTYTYRWTRPDGSMGRLTVGRWPEMKPGEAREAARRESELQDRKGDTLTATAVRRVKRQSVAKAARRKGLARLLGRMARTRAARGARTAARQRCAR